MLSENVIGTPNGCGALPEAAVCDQTVSGLTASEHPPHRSPHIAH